MYICICNAISDRKVKEAVEAGASNWIDVHSHHGCMPNCGQCECDIFDFIKRKHEH
tara:strand:+ start:277 stop:444 length:168 start_codon:yes stop_codon:yes gene_type:complete